MEYLLQQIISTGNMKKEKNAQQKIQKKATYAYTYIKNAYFNKKHSDMSAKKNAHQTVAHITLCNFRAHFNFNWSHFTPQYGFFIFLIEKTE
ncbi:MAG: hypothetical protein EOM47_02640 [Bacteroidia bacterium]|nr:hypothetical protein [Bacteroidia bacterium]